MDGLVVAAQPMAVPTVRRRLSTRFCWVVDVSAIVELVAAIVNPAVNPMPGGRHSRATSNESFRSSTQAVTTFAVPAGEAPEDPPGATANGRGLSGLPSLLVLMEFDNRHMSCGSLRMPTKLVRLVHRMQNSSDLPIWSG